MGDSADCLDTRLDHISADAGGDHPHARGRAESPRMCASRRRFIASGGGVSSWTAKAGVDVVIWAFPGSL